jgi:hypothetical protein
MQLQSSSSSFETPPFVAAAAEPAERSSLEPEPDLRRGRCGVNVWGPTKTQDPLTHGREVRSLGKPWLRQVDAFWASTNVKFRRVVRP